MLLNRNLFGILGLMLAVSLVAFAQDQSPTSTQDSALHQEKSERKERDRERMGRHKRMHGRGMGGLMRELNLSEAQRDQLRAITQRRLELTKVQREELSRLREKRIAGTFSAEDEARAKTLREEIHVSMEGIHLEAEGILTAEQKARLEELKKERKANHEERKARREQRMKERQERLNKDPQ